MPYSSYSHPVIEQNEMTLFLPWVLTQCGLVMPFSNKTWVIIGSAITWTNDDLPSKKLCGIHVRAISQKNTHELSSFIP